MESLSSILLKARAELRSARREMHASGRAANKAQRDFARGKLSVELLEAAVRRHAIALTRAKDLADIAVNLALIANDRRGMKPT